MLYYIHIYHFSTNKINKHPSIKIYLLNKISSLFKTCIHISITCSFSPTRKIEKNPKIVDGASTLFDPLVIRTHNCIAENEEH